MPAPRARTEGDTHEELWLALRAIDTDAGGLSLLEAIAVQAQRLARGSHAEVRTTSLTGESISVCSLLGASDPGTERSCCQAAAREAMRLQLRARQCGFGELVVAGVEPGTPLRMLRRFAAVASARLELERLRDEVATLALEEMRSQRREERFELALASAPVVLATQDRELRYTWVHDPAHRVDEILGRTDFDLLPPGDALRVQALKRRVLETGLAASAEVTLFICGEERTYQMAIDAMRDPWGGITGVTLAAIDITSLAREAGAREQLLLQREDERIWLLSVIERSPVGMLLVEVEEGVERITANRRAAELLGHPLHPARTGQVLEGRLLRPDGTPIPLEGLPSSRALRGERVTAEEALVRRPDGSKIPILVNAGPIVDAAGRQAGAVVTFDDISPYKEVERLREQWTSLITHDLRQPITSIVGFASVLAEHADLPAHLRPKVIHILAAAKRLGRMTSDLLEASRLESNQLDLVRHPTDLEELVGTVVERLAPELEDHPVRVEAHERLPLLEIDPERFEQVLGNLLSNAAKYSPPGSEIAVEIYRRGGEAVVGITNQGQGLPVEELGRLFRRYHRTAAARNSRIRGLGLGLYIARGLVEAHGGRIWAETDPGRSVTFRFSLPIPGGSG